MTVENDVPQGQDKETATFNGNLSLTALIPHQVLADEELTKFVPARQEWKRRINGLCGSHFREIACSDM